jgi:dihydroorotate dehydrogenase (NAD+) catalytic subunit
MAEHLPVELAPGHKQGLLLASPVMTAAGTFGYGLLYEELVEVEKLGAIVTTPTTLRPQRGRPQPRLRELKDGLLLGTGAQNPGLDRVLRQYAPRWERGKVPVILNITGQWSVDFVHVVRRLAGRQGIWGLELTLPDRATAREVREIVSSVRGETLLPLLAKLPLFQIEEVARLCLEAGANALTVGLAPPGMCLDLATSSRVFGRLHGRMLKPLVLRSVDAAVRCTQAPIIACGGIHTAEDALECLASGASAVQLGSAVWVDPRTVTAIAAGIASRAGTVLKDGEL